MTSPTNARIYSAYDPPPSTPKKFTEKSRTRQSEREACNINSIMAKYMKTGMIPINQREAFFADVSEVQDYRTVVERIALVNETFMQLPPDVRLQFENNPALFLDFCADENNREELVKLGLLEQEEKQEMQPVEPAATETPVEGSGTEESASAE